MTKELPKRPRPRSANPWLPGLALGISWLIFGATTFAILGPGRGAAITVLGLFPAFVTFAVLQWTVRRRWVEPIRRLTQEVAALSAKPGQPFDLSYVPELAELLQALRDLKRAWQPVPEHAPPSSYHIGMGSGEFSSQSLMESMTRSGMLAAMPGMTGDGFDANLSGDFSTTDMVSRLEPRSFRWLESSPAEQEFLGWNLTRLREMSFLEIVHPDDYHRAQEQLRTALVKGEVHGLVLRIKTARGKPKAIEMNVGVRYGPDLTITHLRCHVSDVTAKLRAERELKLRTRELMQVNEQLRQINRELEELKDRYRDLYQNAPAMYFSLDEKGRMIECNDTLLRTLGYRRDEVIGRSFERLLVESRRTQFAAKYAEFLRTGAVEAEGQWVKSNGEVIDIWISGTAIRGRDGQFLHSRNAAQDVTARHRLEAELREKHERLARTNEELSRKNKEMDEFTYVVSHDLQEPLRTLIAFSDFLLRDCGDRLDANGQEYVRYLVDASRRMRALIHGLLNLSRAGRVTGELGPVNLDDVVSVVKADLAELIRSKGADVRVSGHLPTWWGDHDRIGQLMANLISNGLKYNKTSAPLVEIGAQPDESSTWATVYVRDNGIGIEPQFHSKIFQLFRRLHTCEEYEGTGAGLAICSKIVQAHGGRIWVESESDQGSTFYVSLRRFSAAAAPAQTEVTHAS